MIGQNSTRFSARPDWSSEYNTDKSRGHYHQTLSSGHAAPSPVHSLTLEKSAIDTNSRGLHTVTIQVAHCTADMATVGAICDPRFGQVKTLLQQFLDSGEELGASISVNLDGETVVDIWGGFADPQRTNLWREDTIVNVFSCTKAVVSLAVLKLVEDGRISVNDKVSDHWPEFAANGKGDIEIRHLMSHTSGVSGWDEPMTLEDLCDLPKSTAALARQTPWWEPGTGSGYHSWTFGHLLGELVRRTTGKSLKNYIMEDIAGPLGADFQIGVDAKDWPRVAVLLPPVTHEFQGPEPGSIAAKTINPVPDATWTATPLWKEAEIGSANGHGNARALTRILSAITLNAQSHGGMLSPTTVDLIFQEQARGVDLAVGIPLRFGIGFGLRGSGDTAVDDWLPPGKICYWGGWGGSIVVIDLDRRLTISYTMNKMSNVGLSNVAARAYIKAVYASMGVDI